MIKTISMKGSHHFWSQLLVSMIAIFALPAAQGLEYPSEIVSENYHNQRYQTPQQSISAAFIVRQVQTGQTLPLKNVAENTNLVKNEPHFFTFRLNDHAPIRAGPVVTL